MLTPSGSVPMLVTCAPRRSQHLRRGHRGGAVGAVDHDRETAEIDVAARHQRVDVAVAALVPGLDRAQALRLGALPGLLERRLDRGLVGVGQLEAVGAEELDAVVGEGVVRGADHRAGHGVGAADQLGDGRRRDHSQQHHVGARAGEPGREGRLEHRAAAACVAADHHPRAVGEAPAQSPPDREGELRGQLTVRDPADAVRTEQPPRCHRGGSGREPATSSRTADAYARP